MARSSLIITVDRLNPSFLGPYGGTWASTPNFNRLAAQSLLLENSVSDAADLATTLRSYWQGTHAAAAGEAAMQTSLAERLRAAGVPMTLVTDDPAAATHPLADAFAERIQLPALAGSTPAADVEQTQFAEALAAALDVFTEMPSPSSLWVHLRGMAGQWDAPQELREALRGDDDPEALSDTTPPALRLSDDYDPDLLLSIAQAYAAQVMLLDMALGVVLATIEAHAARDELLFLLTSPRGYPLGEHLVVGDAAELLYGEVLHTPLLLRCGDGRGAMVREHVLVQPADIAATLADWHGAARSADSPQAASLLSLVAADPPSWPREQTLSLAAGQRATRTASWFLRHDFNDPEQPTVELFSKPDDRFEANEIASRAPLIVEKMLAAQQNFEQALAANDFRQLAPLAPELTSEL